MVGSPPWKATTTSSAPRCADEQLADVGLEHRVVHAEPAAGVELLLRQEEAVLAVEVADRAGRLRHHVEHPWSHSCRCHNVPSVEKEPSSHLGLVVDVTITRHVDDHLVDLAAGERERRDVVRRHGRGVIASDADPVSDRAEQPGCVTIRLDPTA